MLIYKKKVIQREFGPGMWTKTHISGTLYLDDNIEEALYDFENYVNKYCFIKHYKVNNNGICVYMYDEGEYSSIDVSLEVDEEYYNRYDKKIADYFN